jgi:hypothetical protein
VAPADKATYDKSMSDGDSAKKGAIISGVGAVVFGGVGVALGILSREPGPPAIHF